MFSLLKLEQIRNIFNVQVSAVTNSSALGSTANWNYSGNTSSYVLTGKGLRENNLLIVACADNSRNCGGVSPRVPIGTITKVTEKFSTYSGEQGNVAERVQVFLWQTSENISSEETAKVTLVMTDRPNTSTSFALLIN